MVAGHPQAPLSMSKSHKWALVPGHPSIPHQDNSQELLGEVNASCPFSLSNHACGHICNEEPSGMTTWPGGSEPPNSKSCRYHFLAFWFPQYLATTRHRYTAHRLCRQEPSKENRQGMSCWPLKWPLLASRVCAWQLKYGGT